MAETVATFFPLNCREKTWRLEKDIGSRRRRKLWEISAGHHGAFHAGAGDTVLVQRHDHDTRRNAHQNT